MSKVEWNGAKLFGSPDAEVVTCECPEEAAAEIFEGRLLYGMTDSEVTDLAGETEIEVAGYRPQEVGQGFIGDAATHAAEVIEEMLREEFGGPESGPVLGEKGEVELTKSITAEVTRLLRERDVWCCDIVAQHTYTGAELLEACGFDVPKREPVERPIRFNDEMMRRVLDGSKTQTRRAIDPQPRFAYPGTCRLVYGRHPMSPSAFAGTPAEGRVPGEDRMGWLGEDWCGNVVFVEEADAIRCPYGVPGDRLRPDASTLLEVTEVRIEQVRGISEADALAEGVRYTAFEPAPDAAREAYRVLWDSIYEERGFGWGEDPWCWAVSFREVTS